MPLLVVFVTGDATVIDTIRKRQAFLIPPDLRANRFAALSGEEVAISGYRILGWSTFNQLVGHIGDMALSTASGVLLLTEDSLPGLVDRLGDIFSVNRFKPPTRGQDPANILTAILAKCLRTFRHFMKRFDDMKYHRILRLPLRNFAAAETRDLRDVCHDMMNSDNFGREIDTVLQQFRRRQRPKKVSSYRDEYLIDDDGKHFRFGPEVHARADTACPPHNPLCVLGNKFRFGSTFDGTKHFNVSYDGDVRMDGEYPDCHGVKRSGRGGSHLNMFTSDFF